MKVLYSEPVLATIRPAPPRPGDAAGLGWDFGQQRPSASPSALAHWCMTVEPFNEKVWLEWSSEGRQARKALPGLRLVASMCGDEKGV